MGLDYFWLTILGLVPEGVMITAATRSMKEVES